LEPLVVSQGKFSRRTSSDVPMSAIPNLLPFSISTSPSSSFAFQFPLPGSHTLSLPRHNISTTLTTPENKMTGGVSENSHVTLATDLTIETASSPSNYYSPYTKNRTLQHFDPSSTPELSVVDAELRRRKHNQAEKRRRNKIKDTFKELATLVECSRTQKSTILRVAIDKVHNLQNKCKTLKNENDELKKKIMNNYNIKYQLY